MASIIAGYNYDIFISYRQKDNKHDGWVTEFVDNLKGELESVFKEDVTIYFDENPHDRLQETHNVSKSLEDKLKCLIFIPVLSQTYCDTESYAWKYELQSFVRNIENDRFGKDIRLKNGNYASRILPVRIHDLDPEDIGSFEKETGGVLRSVDFVFRTSSGVNRPLRSSEDNPSDNLNRTFFRDQINKTANAIKELITGMKSGIVVDPLKKVTTQQKQPVLLQPANIGKIHNHVGLKQKWAIGAIIIAFLSIALILSRFFSHDKNLVSRDSDGRISIAINSFENNTSDPSLSYLEEGIPELLRINLGNLPDELSVQDYQTINELYGSLKETSDPANLTDLSRETAKRLKTSTYITGSFQMSGDKILTLTKLIDTRTDELLWTGRTEGTEERITELTDSLSNQLRNFLEIKALKQKTGPEFGDAFTRSAEAHRKYINGMQSMINLDPESAVTQFQEALKLDSTFVLASFYLANALDQIGVFRKSLRAHQQAAYWIKKTYEGRSRLPENYRVWLEMWYAYYVSRNTSDVMKYCGLLEKSDIQSRYFWRDIADTYMNLDRWTDALRMYEKIEETSKRWKEDWNYKPYYFQYAGCCCSLKLFRRAEKIVQKGFKVYPDDPDLLGVLVRISIEKNDTLQANLLLNKIAELRNWDNLGLTSAKAGWYDTSGKPDLAEKYYRMTLSLDNKNDYRFVQLGKFLIESGRSVDEGMALFENIEKKYPGIWNNYFFTNKSIGLVRQGKFSEADSLIKILSDSIPVASVDLDRLKKMLQDSLRR